MHRIEFLSRVVENKNPLRGVEHIRCIAIAGGEIEDAHIGETVVPFGDARVERGLWLDRYDRRTGGGDGIGGGGIGARASAIKQHLFEFVEETVINQSVKIGIDLFSAEPCVAIAGKTQMRPIVVAHHVPA